MTDDNDLYAADIHSTPDPPRIPEPQLQDAIVQLLEEGLLERYIGEDGRTYTRMSAAGSAVVNQVNHDALEKISRMLDALVRDTVAPSTADDELYAAVRRQVVEIQKVIMRADPVFHQRIREEGRLEVLAKIARGEPLVNDYERGVREQLARDGLKETDGE
jgi:hypothetical protein